MSPERGPSNQDQDCPRAVGARFVSPVLQARGDAAINVNPSPVGTTHPPSCPASS